MTASNTPGTYYKDSAAVRKHCQEDYAKIAKECGPDDPPANDPKAKPKVRPSIRKLLGKKYKEKGHAQTLSRGGTDNQSWMADNCDFLWIPPGPDSHGKFLEKIGELKGDLAEAVENQLKKTLDAAKEKITKEAVELAEKKAGKAAARAGGRWVIGAGGAAVGGVGAIVTEGIATIWNLVDMASTGYEVATAGYSAYKELGQLDDILKEYKGIGDELERLGRQARDDPQKAVADFMSGASKLNPCMRARRCSLVPKGKANSMSGEGCCPGQTGHHLIPDAAVKDAGCPGYDYQQAPTVCAEGTGNSHGGAHQKLHDSLDRRVKKYSKDTGKDMMSYDEYRKEAIKTFSETFPESGCDKKCLQAQLDAHYNCGGKKLKAVSGKGGGTGGMG